MVPDSSMVRAWGGAGMGGRDIRGKQGDIYNTLKNKNKLKKKKKHIESMLPSQKNYLPFCKIHEQLQNSCCLGL